MQNIHKPLVRTFAADNAKSESRMYLRVMALLLLRALAACSAAEAALLLRRRRFGIWFCSPSWQEKKLLLIGHELFGEAGRYA